MILAVNDGIVTVADMRGRCFYKFCDAIRNQYTPED